MSYIKGQLVLSKQILNILPSALIFMDADGTIERINDEAVKELDLEDEDVTGKSIFEIISIVQNHQNITSTLIEELKQEEKIIDFPKETFIKSELKKRTVYCRRTHCQCIFKEETITNYYLFPQYRGRTDPAAYHKHGAKPD